MSIYKAMNTLNFKNWFVAEDANPNDEKAISMDPNLSTAAKKAQVAVQAAINKGQNPIKAAQMAVAQSKVPPNKLGQIMPQDTIAQNKT